MNAPITDKIYLLEKYPGKGGWTYAQIPEALPQKENPFGWVKIKGNIDGFEFSKYHLMPMGNGKLFLPVKAEIRKKIKKEAGDTVHIVLFIDQDPLEIPEEFRDCLNDEPLALSFFNALPQRQQEQYVKWIYATKSPEIKIQRLAHAINRLLQSLPCEF
jgi:hypothetical protein